MTDETESDQERDKKGKKERELKERVERESVCFERKS